MTCTFLEKCMRFGVSCICKRYTKASNKYLSSYDPKKSKKIYITYLDKNNFFGYAMSKSIPAGGFNCLDLAKSNLDKYNDNIYRDCALEVDLDYLKELHELQELLITIIFLLIMLKN